MKLIFDDLSMSYQLIRTIGHTYYDGADIAECISTAYGIKDGDEVSWYEQWLKTAHRIDTIANDCLVKGHQVSAREAFLRSSNYYRTAEFYLGINPTDARALGAWKKSRDDFRQAAELFFPPIETIEIPYEHTKLPGYFLKVDTSATPRPTLILMTGFDGTAEELYFEGGAAAVRRGYNCLMFEGPGQGQVIREQNITFRPDWENVAAPIIDYALTRPEVDSHKIAIMGVSMGGYLAPRAAAFDHRVAAMIANEGVFGLVEAWAAKTGMPKEQIVESARESPQQVNDQLYSEMENDLSMRWGLNQGMWAFGASTPSELIFKAADYTMEGIADKITCPCLVCDSTGEDNYPGQAKQLYDTLTSPKTYLLFGPDEAAEVHCQEGASAISHQKIFDWLDEILGITTQLQRQGRQTIATSM